MSLQQKQQLAAFEIAFTRQLQSIETTYEAKRTHKEGQLEFSFSDPVFKTAFLDMLRAPKGHGFDIDFVRELRGHLTLASLSNRPRETSQSDNRAIFANQPPAP